MSNQESQPRPPVIVVAGHVDHGKTSLLDYIRKENVAAGEEGGITQAVGAYEIEQPVKQDATGQAANKRLTFIDTPGHEAFSAMRQRGANIADLAILIVAADEGVKPQTKEVIHVFKTQEIPFVVAINKIDKTGADVEKVKNELMTEEVLLEGAGGNISYQPVSAETGEGVDELLDLLVLASDLEELQYDPTAPAEGYVLESQLNKSRGIEATLIVKDGVLRRGDEIATPSTSGKVKILENFRGEAADELHAGAPALVVGLDGIPQAGDRFAAGPKAKEMLAETKGTAGQGVIVVPGTTDEVAPTASEGKKVSLVLRADDSGSLEALLEVIKSMEPELELNIIDYGVGDVTESDVKTATSANAVVVGFKTHVDKAAQSLAIGQSVRIITSPIIYELVDAIGELVEEKKTAVLGVLEVLKVFNAGKLHKQVVGGKVVKGELRNRKTVAIERDGERLGEGDIKNLQSGKEDATRVEEGNEAGLLVGSPIAIEKGDMLVVEED